MNVAAASPPTAAPVAETGVGAIAGAAQGGARQGGAPTGFDALLAMVGAALSPEGGLGVVPGDKANDDATATDATDQTTVTDPLAAALAAMMAAPAPQPVPTTPVPATGDASAAPPIAAVAPTTFAPPVVAAAEVTPGTDAVVPAPAAAPTTPAPVETAPVQTVAAEPVVPPAPVLVAAAETVAQSAKPAAPAKETAEPTKTDRGSRTAATPAVEGETRPAARSVQTETANAVAAIGADGKTGDGSKPEAAQAPQAAPQAPSQGNAQPAPTVDHAAMALTSAAVAPPPIVRGSPDTVAKLSADILKKLDGHSTRFDVALDPHGLGRVDVRVEINRNGEMTAALSFDNPQAAAELRGRASELRSALQQAGFDLPENALSFDMTNQGGGGRDSAAQQAFDFHDQQGRGSAFAGRAFQATADGAETLAADLSTRLYAARDGVDIRI